MCQHLNYVIDHTSACTVCIDCGQIIENQVFVYDDFSALSQRHFNHFHEFIRDCCHRIYIIDTLEEKIIENYDRFVSLNKSNNKFVIAAYSIYYTLKTEDVPRNLKTISNITGISKKQLFDFDAKLQIYLSL